MILVTDIISIFTEIFGKILVYLRIYTEVK